VEELGKVEIHRISDHRRKIESDLVISEVEVLMRINERAYRSLYCSPSLLEEMARGHLISEGISFPSGIKGVEVKEDAGKFIIAATVDELDRTRPNNISSEIKMSTADIWDAVKGLDEHGILFKKTGGAHVAEIHNELGSVFAEDISRHCAIDKAIGLALKNELDLTTSALVTSCRQTASTIAKAIHGQIPIVITISSPTDLVIKSAERMGITLIGFARGHRFNIYSHEWKITEK
jgi:FdhD protein